jgi:hypothetical protein
MIVLWMLPLALLLSMPVLAQKPAPAPAQQPAASTQEGPPITESLRVECSAASQAQSLIGQNGCVAGKVLQVNVGKNGNVHLHLCPAHSGCYFHAVVHSHDRARVGDLTYLRGRIVAFTGPITSYREHPQIVIRSREQVHVAAGETPSQFDADRTSPVVNPEAPPHGTKHEKAWR